MDENPYRSPGRFAPVPLDHRPRTTIGSVLRLLVAIWIGSAVGSICGVVVCFAIHAMFPVPRHMSGEIGEQRITLCLAGGMTVGGLGGLGMREALIRRPKR